MENQNNIRTTLNILSLEDSPYDFEIIRGFLLDAGIDAAMDRVDREPDFISSLHKQKYDIILADYNLPDYDAVSALKKSKEIVPDIPFIVVSGSIGEEKAIELIKQGAVDYVLKDKPDKLAYAVTRALEEAKEKEARILAEKEAKESEAKYRALYENSINGIFRSAPDGHLLEVNPAYAHMFGYNSPAEIIAAINNVGAQLYLYPEQRKEVIDILAANGEMEPREFEAVRRDGTPFWVLIAVAEVIDANGNLLYYEGTSMDITMRKRTEKALKENEERFKKVIECSGVWIWEVDAKGMYTYVSPMEENILGYKTDEIIGKKYFYDSFAPEIKVEMTKAALGVFAEKGVFTNLENANIHKDGHIVILSTSGSPLLDAKGNLLGYRGADTDITLRKQGEEEIKRINAELEQRVHERTFQLETINKELESFSYSVSHDLRSPLRSIDGFSNLLLKNYSNLLDDQGKDYFQRVMKASRRMGLLIDDLMKLSRFTRIEMKRGITNLSSIAESIVEEFKSADPERQINIFIQPGMIANVDSDLIQNALQNLFDNAWKYSKNKADAKIEFGAMEKDGNTVYYVRDNGAGFDMKYVDKLFSAFQRLHSDDEFEGTGIGLATVNRIIHRHGGTIWAEGAVNSGATFYFTLNNPL
jgi:PAS domain S-box-containing protein